MPIIDDFHGRPTAGEGQETDNPVERDLLAMPLLPWKALLATLLTVALGFGIAHVILLATKEKNKLITETLALQDNKVPPAAAVAIGSVDEAVLIPAGSFVMGRAEDDPEEPNSDSTPAHEVFLPDFYIGKYEVTNAQYQEFVQAKHYIPPTHWKGKTTYPEGTGDLPVTYVNWEQARDYAHWRGGRLCTEAEWEKAARGTDRRIYPYGNEYDPAKANIDYLIDKLMPVGSYPEGESPYGVDDMMGNLYEWTASRYAPYPGNRDEPGQYAAYKVNKNGDVVIDPDRESYYVVTRGGCWKCDRFSSQTTTRNPTRPSYASDFFGIRVCWDKPEIHAAAAKK